MEGSFGAEYKMIARVGDHYRRHLAHRAASRPLLKFPLHLARAKLTEIAALNVRATVAPLRRVLSKYCFRCTLCIDSRCKCFKLGNGQISTHFGCALACAT